MSWYVPDYEMSFNNREDVLRFPINPQDPPEIYIPGNSQNWTTTDAGTFKAIGWPGLSSFTFKTWYPVRSYPFELYSSYPTFAEAKAMLEKWQNSRRPIRFIITDFLNDAFSIEGMSFQREIATGDVNITIDLERYRFYTDYNPDTGNSYRDGVSFEVGDTLTAFVTLEYGQTLCELAEEWLGDSDRYTDIAKWNGIEDVGHPWDATASTNHSIQIICESGTPGYIKQQEQVQNGVAVG